MSSAWWPAARHRDKRRRVEVSGNCFEGLLVRRSVIASLAVSVLVIGAVPAAGISPVVPGVDAAVVISPNLTHVGTLPLDAGAVSMRVVRVGKQTRAFVSTTNGLSIYDATNPRVPQLLGRLPLYNWENEDVAVSPDGRTVLLTEWNGLLYLHVIDVSNPLAPRLSGTLPLAGDHTVACADPSCMYVFGSEGNTYDIRNRAEPVRLPRAQSWGALTGAGGGHALHRDAAGIWVTDTNPLVVFRLDPHPLKLKVLTRGQISMNSAYQHNNIRPRSMRYVPRTSLTGPLRDGELLLGQGETTSEPKCNSGTGAFSTWSMAGFDRGVPMRQLATLRPLTNRPQTEDAAVNALGCSGHWFTQKNGRDGSILVASAWYEHGTRLLSVNPRNGAIKQIGFFQPRRGSASGAYWMPGTDVIWTIDYFSGIDILAFDPSTKKLPSANAIEQSWLAQLQPDPFSEALRELCRAGADATANQHHAVRRLLS